MNSSAVPSPAPNCGNNCKVDRPTFFKKKIFNWTFLFKINLLKKKLTSFTVGDISVTFIFFPQSHNLHIDANTVYKEKNPHKRN